MPTISQRRVGLLRCRRVHPDAHTSLLRAPRHRRSLRLLLDRFPAVSDELTNRWHYVSSFLNLSQWALPKPTSYTRRFSACHFLPCCCEVICRLRSDCGLLRRSLFGGLRDHLGLEIVAETGPGRNEPPDDHVLFEASQLVPP